MSAIDSAVEAYLVIICAGKPMGYETTEEFADRVGVNMNTVRVWERRGLLKTLHIGRDRFIKKGTQRPTRAYNRRA